MTEEARCVYGLLPDQACTLDFTYLNCIGEETGGSSSAGFLEPACKFLLF